MELQSPFLVRIQELVDVPLDLGVLRRVIMETAVSESELKLLSQADSTHPYGRRVLFQSLHVEVMLATWTRCYPCSPHDHGGSVGAVRVMQGRSRHRLWRVHEGRLRLCQEETVEAGGLLVVGADLIHSMEDGGAPEPLMTLHLYTNPIRYMVVYDTEGQRTLVVHGSSGAWIPKEAPHLILGGLQGIHPPRVAADMLAVTRV